MGEIRIVQEGARPGALVVGHVGAGVAHRVAAAAAAAAVRRTAVHGHGVEGQEIARLHVPAREFVLLPLPVDVGDGDVLGIARVGCPALGKGFGLKEGAPLVRSAHELERAALGGDRIERDPEGHDVFRANRPIREIVVPARGGVGPRLLHEELVVVDLDAVHPEQRGGECGQRRLAAVGGKIRVGLPDPHVAVEATAAFHLVAVKTRRRRSDVALDRRRQPLEPGRVDRARQKDGAVSFIGLALGVGDQGCCSSWRWAMAPGSRWIRTPTAS